MERAPVSSKRGRGGGPERGNVAGGIEYAIHVRRHRPGYAEDDVRRGPRDGEKRGRCDAGQTEREEAFLERRRRFVVCEEPRAVKRRRGGRTRCASKAHTSRTTTIATIRIPNANGLDPGGLREGRRETPRTERADPPGTSRGEARTTTASSEFASASFSSRTVSAASNALESARSAQYRYRRHHEGGVPRHPRIANANGDENDLEGPNLHLRRLAAGSSMLSAERRRDARDPREDRFRFRRRRRFTSETANARCATIAASNAAAVGTPCESMTCATAKRAARLRLLVGFESVASTRRSVAIAAATTS